MMKQTSWMKGVALLAGVCASGLAAGCMTEPMANDQEETDSSDLAVKPLTVAGIWTAPPGNGVMIGFGGGVGPLTVCRSNFDGGQQPGKLWEAQCNFGWGGQEVRSSDYQVLLDSGFTWAAAGSTLPANAVDGGDAGITAHDVRLGVCQAFNSTDGTWHPGKFYAGNCNIAWGGRELVVSPSTGNVRILVQ